jgi:hypothetical protein
MSDNATLVADTVRVGDPAQGFFNQNGGTATINNLSVGHGIGGLGSFGMGTFSLTAGTLKVGFEEVDGYGGIFQQTGGDNTSNVLMIGSNGSGTFTLADGTLTVLGSDDYAGGGEYLGYISTAAGTFNQTGGIHVVKANVLLLGFGTHCSGSYNLSGGSLSTPKTQLGEGGTGTFNQSGGTHVTDSLVLGAESTAHATYLLSAGNLSAKSTLNNGTITQTGGTASLGPVDGTGSIIVSGGSLSAAHLRQASLSLSASGQIAIAPGGGDAGVSRLATLSIDTSASSTAQLDLADNALVLDYTVNSPLPAVRAALLSAYAGGTRSGPGLTSSSAASGSSHSLAYVEAADLLHLTGSATATWKGQTIDATTVLVDYALDGDTNLDGAVNFADLVTVAQNYGKNDGTATWWQGDLNYDGNVNFADLVKIAQNYGAGLPANASSNGLGSDLYAALAGVPEPSSMTLAVIAASVFGRRPLKPRAEIVRI